MCILEIIYRVAGPSMQFQQHYRSPSMTGFIHQPQMFMCEDTNAMTEKKNRA